MFWRIKAVVAALIGLCSISSAAETPAINATYYMVLNGYAVSWAYPMIRLDSARNRGWTGQNVTVALFDTGLDIRNPKFAGNLSNRSYDIYSGGAVTGDPNGHGTFVGSIIAANTSGVGATTMYGVAPNAKLMPIRIMDSRGAGTFTDAQLARGIDFATSNGARVFNNSWNVNATMSDLGSSRTQLLTYFANTLAAYGRASSRGVINVWAAGNSGRSDPGYMATLPQIDDKLRGSWIVVVAADINGQIASWSNRCGTASSFCITAPGANIVGAYQNGLALGSGTSFAAPMVAGGVSLMLQQWPYLTGSQITSILFRTANKSGVYANASIYGQGMLDLDKATMPIGQVTVPTAATIANGTALGNAVLVLPRSLGSISVGGQVMVVDEYGRAYDVALDDMMVSSGSGLDLRQALSKFMDQRIQRSDESTGTTVAFTADANLPDGEMSRMPLGSGGYGFMDMGLDPKTVVRYGDVTAWASQSQPVDEFGISDGSSSRQVGVAKSFGDVSIGMVSETQSMYGVQMPVGSSLGSSASHAWIGWQHKWTFGHGFELATNASVGSTVISGYSGMVNDVSTLISDSYGLALSKRGVTDDRDSMGIGLQMPLQTLQGHADLNVPVSRDMDGNVAYEQRRISLVGSSRERDIQIWYKRELSQESDVMLMGGLRLQPGGSSTAANDHVVMAGYRLHF